jgi:S1-C subfamily serine protease
MMIPMTPAGVRTWSLLIVASVFLSSSLGLAQEKTEDPPRTSRRTELVKKVKPALVFVQEPKAKDEEKPQGSKQAPGIIIDAKKGTVLTNHSVVKGWKNTDIVLADGRRLSAKVVLSDPDLDLVVLSVQDAKPLPVVIVGDSDQVAVADFVLIYNTPFSTAVDDPLLILRGVIGGKGRRTKQGELVFTVDTAIGPGSGPGPVFNEKGEFIGLVVGQDSRFHGVNTVIPSNRLMKRVAEGTTDK